MQNLLCISRPQHKKKSLQEAQSVKKLLKKYGIKIDILRNKRKFLTTFKVKQGQYAINFL